MIETINGGERRAKGAAAGSNAHGESALLRRAPVGDHAVIVQRPAGFADADQRAHHHKGPNDAE